MAAAAPVCETPGCDRPAPVPALIGDPLIVGAAAYAPACPFCPRHCRQDDCEAEMHADFRQVRLQAACRLNRYEVADDHGGICPCGAALPTHPRPPQNRRLEGPAAAAEGEVVAPPADVVRVVVDRPTAAIYGLTPAEFAAHPVNFTDERWRELLRAIQGPSRERRITEHRIRTLERQKTARETAYESSVHEIAIGCKFISGHVREFAGLLAAMTSISTLNEAHLGPPVVGVVAAALMAGEPGVIPAQDALNDVAVMRLVREGRQWFLQEADRIKEKHKAAAVQYVSTDPKTSAKRAFAWPERYTKTLLLSYSRFLQERPPTWSLQGLQAYLTESWLLPLRDATASMDLTPFFVQAGILSLVEQCEQFEPLGDAMVAITAHVNACYTRWQEKFVLSSANLAEHKKLTATVDKQPAAKVKLTGASPAGSGTPTAALAAAVQGTARLARNVPQAVAAGIPGDRIVYNRCQHAGPPACMSVPPGGFSTGKWCLAHNPNPTGGGGRGGAGAGGRQNDRRQRSGRGWT